MQRHIPSLLKTLLLLLLAADVLAQQPEQKPAENKSAAPPVVAPAARLLSAKTVMLKKTGSKDSIAYDVVSTTLEGWGRFMLVSVPENADIIVEVFSVEESGGGVSASTEVGGRRRSSGTASPGTAALIKLTVYDAKNHIALWTGAERPKGAMKKVDRENNEVAAAQRLVSKFHDYVEPVQNSN